MLLALALLGGAHARADGGDPKLLFAQARSAFDAENFPGALELFERCLVLGMHSPALHYNIGVAAYRSGQLARAERAFRTVADTPAMATLAHYNLGLVALKRGDGRAARAWFERAARDGSDERLAALAAQRLAELPAAPRRAPWSAYARGGIGHDDNVALRAGSLDAPGSGDGDSFAQLLAAGSWSLRPAWRVDGAASVLRHASRDDFDQSALSLGAAYTRPLAAWDTELGAHASRLALGGEVFERSMAASAQATKSFAARQRLRGLARVAAVDGEGDFSGLSGTRYELRVRYDWGWQSWTFATHAGAERNDTGDDAFASRWTELGAEARWAYSPQWTFAAGGALRRTRYALQTTTDGAPDERRTALRLEAGRALSSQAQVLARYEHERNDSGIEARDYDRNWLLVAIEIWR